MRRVASEAIAVPSGSTAAKHGRVHIDPTGISTPVEGGMSGIHARCRDRSIDRNVERDEACACLASEHTLSRKRVNVSLQACNSRSRHENCTEESAASRCMTPVAGRDIHMRVHAGFEPMSAWKANAVECRVPRMDLASSNRCNAKQDMQAVDLSTLHRDTGNGAGVRNARTGERTDSGVGGESGTHSAHPCASVRPAQMRGRSTASGSAARTPRLALRAASPCGSALLPIRRTVGSSSSPPTPPDTHNARARRALCVSGGESGIRTHGRFDPSPVFKTGALNRSAISPC